MLPKPEVDGDEEGRGVDVDLVLLLDSAKPLLMSRNAAVGTFHALLIGKNSNIYFFKVKFEVLLCLNLDLYNESHINHLFELIPLTKGYQIVID